MAGLNRKGYEEIFWCNENDLHLILIWIWINYMSVCICQNLSKMYYLCISLYVGFLVAQLVKNLLSIWETWFRSLDWKDPLEKERLTSPVFWPREFHGLYSAWGGRVGHN